MMPTQRGTDSWGSGWYLAPRGNHRHHGIDLGAYPGMPILSVVDGVYNKLGYPYNPSDSKRGHLRYVQVADSSGRHFRYFYVTPDPRLRLGGEIEAGDVIGYAQGLQRVYPGITDHIHFEVKQGSEYLNPTEFLS